MWGNKEFSYDDFIGITMYLMSQNIIAYFFCLFGTEEILLRFVIPYQNLNHPMEFNSTREYSFEELFQHTSHHHMEILIYVNIQTRETDTNQTRNNLFIIVRMEASLFCACYYKTP